MTTPPMRWLLNTRTGTLHDRRNLHEECNTDDIERRYRFLTPDADEAMTHLAFRRACAHCARKTARRTRVIANPDLSATAPDAATPS